MTTSHAPDHLLTLQEWEGLDEDVYRRAELVGGLLELTPSPGGRHQMVLARLLMAVAPGAAMAGFFPLPELDVLIDPTFPATVRQPDISIVHQSVADRGPKRLTPADVVVAVEIVSPGSGRRDRVVKLAEYAHAQIPHYWIVNIAGAAIGFDRFRLDHDTYQLSEHAEGGTVTASEPFSLTLDLDALRTW